MSEDAAVAIDQHGLADQRWKGALALSAEAPRTSGWRRGCARSPMPPSSRPPRFAIPTRSGWDGERKPARAAGICHMSCVPAPRGGVSGDRRSRERFDAAVEQLWTALEGVALAAVARAFTAVSDVTRELADEIDAIDRERLPPEPSPTARRHPA